MLRTIYGQVSFSALVCVLLAAAIFGGRPERLGAILLGGGSLASMGCQALAGVFDPVAPLMLVDLAVLGGLVLLTWHASAGWPFFAVAFQGVGVAVHVIRLLSPAMHPWIYLTALAATEYGVIGSLGAGSLLAGWRRRPV